MVKMTNDVPVNDIINPNFLLLNTCFTISHIKNKDLVKYMHTYNIGKELRAYIYGGH